MLSITDITVAYMPSILMCYLIIRTLEITNMATEDVKELGIRNFPQFSLFRIESSNVILIELNYLPFQVTRTPNAFLQRLYESHCIPEYLELFLSSLKANTTDKITMTHISPVANQVKT
jgi:hypothetical protein